MRTAVEHLSDLLTSRVALLHPAWANSVSLSVQPISKQLGQLEYNLPKSVGEPSRDRGGAELLHRGSANIGIALWLRMTRSKKLLRNYSAFAIPKAPSGKPPKPPKPLNPDTASSGSWLDVGQGYPSASMRFMQRPGVYPPCIMPLAVGNASVVPGKLASAKLRFRV